MLPTAFQRHSSARDTAIDLAVCRCGMGLSSWLLLLAALALALYFAVSPGSVDLFGSHFDVVAPSPLRFSLEQASNGQVVVSSGFVAILATAASHRKAGSF